MLLLLSLLASNDSRADDSAPDRWAPGASAQGWDRIARLQAYPEFSKDEPDWVAAMGDRDPFVRTAGVLALGRAKLPGGAERLGPSLNDESRLVRTSALWALLQFDSEAARARLLPVIAGWRSLHPEPPDWPATVPVAGYGPLFGLAGLPPDLVQLRRDERSEWLSRFDSDSWRVGPPTPVAAGTGALRSWLCTERSEWDADESVNVAGAFEVIGGSGSVRVDLRYLSWQDVSAEAFDGSRAGSQDRPSLRDGDGKPELQVEGSVRRRLTLTGNPATRPGVFVLQGPGTANPLLFRVRRTLSFDREVAPLIDNVERDPTSVQRLGDMRVRRASPALVGKLRNVEVDHGAEERGRLRLRILEALSRIEDPDAAAAVVPELMRSPFMGIGDVHYLLGDLLKQFGGLARPYVEGYVLNWSKERDTGRGAGLSDAVSWTGYARGSAFARAVEEIAVTLARSGDLRSPGDSLLLGAAIRSVARIDPSRAADLFAEALRRPDADRSLLSITYPAYRRATEDEVAGWVLSRVWASLRDDPAVPKDMKRELLGSVLADEAPLSIAVQLDNALRIKREGLDRQDDAASELALAELERRRGRWSEAITLAREALPRLAPQRQPFAHWVLGSALAATGDVVEARLNLETLDKLGTPSEANAPREEPWRRNLETRPSVAGVGIRYEAVRGSGDTGLRSGSFWTQSANRLRFSAQAAETGKLVAVTPSPVRQLVEVGHRRVAVALADGSAAVYESDKAAPVWRTDPSLGIRRILAGPGLVVAEGGQGVTALDPGSGHVLWSRHEGSVVCEGTVSALGNVTLASAEAGAKPGQAKLWHLTEHDGRTGALLWNRLLPREIVTCTADLERLVAVEGSSPTYAMETSTGKVLWGASVWWWEGRFINAGPPLTLSMGPGDTLLGLHGTVVVAASMRTGKELWRFRWSPPPDSKDSSPTLLMAPGARWTYVVGSWYGRDGRRYAHLHEVVRLTSDGQVAFRAQGPIYPGPGSAGVTQVRATADGVVVSRGDLDEIWSFADGVSELENVE